MKGIISRGTAVALSVLAATVFSLAQTSVANPLNAPRGLALAANGNLYVANSGGNNVLVFNPNYALVSSRTITAGISKPTAVVFDSAGNLFVANIGTESITEYSSAGVQNTAATITAAINTPEALAIDPMNNLYVNNGFGYVSVYASNLYPGGGVPPYAQMFTPNVQIYGIATHGQFFAWGGVSLATVEYTDEVLGSGLEAAWVGTDAEGLALAFDATGNLYVANADATVSFINFANGSQAPFTVLPFVAEGIAVDSKRSRVYFSSQSGNAIAVYSTAGALLKTIQ
ncbi:MAG TPA: hypothetical protein VMH04_11505 [Candidatus Solibacter sp.]|nr:hypothetical protein [Candidatus Solibacter sp.]